MRRTGRTTRVIDVAIQKLFENGCIVIPSRDNLTEGRNLYVKGKSEKIIQDLVIDPDYNEGSSVQIVLFEKILRRLEVEHDRRLFTIDRGNGRISVKKDCLI